jgi:type II secretory pathway component PulF
MENKDYTAEVVTLHAKRSKVIVTAKSKDEAVRRLKACQVKVVSIEENEKREMPRLHPKKEDTNHRSLNIAKVFSIPKRSTNRKNYK